MQPHQARVIAEKAELDSKIEKLAFFIQGDVYSALEPEERLRLTRQLVHMKDYSDTLSERIAAFK